MDRDARAQLELQLQLSRYRIVHESGISSYNLIRTLARTNPSWRISTVDWIDLEFLRQLADPDSREYIPRERVVAVPPDPTPRVSRLRSGHNLLQMADHMGTRSQLKRSPVIKFLNGSFQGLLSL